MKHSYIVHGMTCGGCLETVESALVAIDGITSVEVSLEPPEATLVMSTHISLETLNKVLAAAGSYSMTAKGNAAVAEVLPEKSAETYKPLIVVLGFVLLVTIISQVNAGSFNWMDAMRVFMGSFFLAFSFFKILDVKGFAYSYMSYDIVAKRWLGWGFIYPFIELALGIAYLTSFEPMITNGVTLVVMGVSSVGVIQSVLKKQQIKCACLGTGFNLPMSTVTILEDVTMVVMAAVMLFVN